MLWHKLKNFPNDTVLVVGPRAEIRIGDILDFRRDMLAKKPKLSGLSFLLALSDGGMALKILALLDGVAANIGFVSPDLDSSELGCLAEEGDFDFIILDEGRKINIPEGCSLLGSADCLGGIASGDEQAKTTNTSWIMTTSGTTAMPKLVRHKFASLTKTTKGISAAHANIVWGMIYDFSRFAGMQVYLQSILNGAKLVMPDRQEPLANQLVFFAEHSVTHLSATPTMWRKILMCPESLNLNISHATLGGEIVDQNILDAIIVKFPKARVTHIFASTEAGVGFSVNDAKAGFPISYLDSPRYNTELKISETGILLIRNKTNAAQYVGDGSAISDPDGWIATGDLVEVAGDRLYFVGRESGHINVGGDKIMPETVELVLQEHPAVCLAKVYAKKNPITGALVAADLVLEPGSKTNTADIKKEIKAFASTRLRRFEVPATINFVPEIGMNASGKIVRTTA